MAQSAQLRASEELMALFCYNPPSTSMSEESNITFSYPNMFYDRHLDPRLCLKHIKGTPSLSLELGQLVLDEMNFVKSRGQFLPLIDNGNDKGTRFSTKSSRVALPPRTTLRDASSVARFYHHVSYKICSPIASTITLHPHAETWLTVLDLCEGSEPELDHPPAMVDDYTLEIYHHGVTGELTIPEAILSCLHGELLRDIRVMSNRFPTLAVFQFHAPVTAVKELFEDMGVVAMKSRNRVSTLECSAIGPIFRQDVTLSPYPDSIVTIESLLCIKTLFSERRRSVRLSCRKEGQPEKPQKSSQDRTWPTINVKRLKVPKPDCTSLLQHAWTRAVQSDSTLIIFNCGNFERIGLRHRDSQTLCISDLIDVSKGPNYCQTQVGLYIAILKDARDRARQINTRIEETKRKKRKRFDSSGCTNATRRSKRHVKTLASGEQDRNVESVDEGHSILFRETSRRNFALLRLQYGVFNSPAPAALYRIGCAASSYVTVDNSPANYPMKQTYTREEYFRITLTSEIAEGATGKVHDAVIEIQTNDGCINSCVGVVKVALESRKRDRLRHEYAVYRYMAAKKVKHVATVYGLFEDAADEAMILVMSHAGISLVTQPHYRERGEVSLTEQEQEAFKAAMTEIHNAGVRHYDIRPENLMLDDRGRATIVDFDIAKVKAGKRSRQREFAHLCSLLRGRYRLPNEWPSPRTSASAEFPPADDDILEGRI